MENGTIYNIAGVYAMADEVDREEGRIAYRSYNQTMRNFATVYGVSVEVATGIFAALSPMNDYWGNLRSLKSVLVGVREGKKPHDIIVTTTHSNKRNAYDIATGTPPNERLKGKKVWAFYNNLVNPDDAFHVTIDRHALSVWVGRRVTDPRVPRYEMVAEDYREAARRLKILPSQLQAITWFTWKRLHGISYKANMDLFLPDNQWRNVAHPDEVSLFPERSLKGRHTRNESLAEGEAVIPAIGQARPKISPVSNHVFLVGFPSISESLKKG